MSEVDMKKTAAVFGQGDSEKKEAGTERDAETARATGEDATGNASEEAGKDEEVGGPKGPEPTRFGDWERKGRCIDF
jgi:hypothetical protein